MPENNYNMINPVEGLNNLAAINPVDRRKERQKKQNPDKEFFAATDKAICPNMKLINLEKIAWSLEDIQYRIAVPEPVRIRAEKSLERMLEV